MLHFNCLFLFRSPFLSWLWLLPHLKDLLSPFQSCVRTARSTQMAPINIRMKLEMASQLKKKELWKTSAPRSRLWRFKVNSSTPARTAVASNWPTSPTRTDSSPRGPIFPHLPRSRKPSSAPLRTLPRLHLNRRMQGNKYKTFMTSCPRIRNVMIQLRSLCERV